MRILFEGQGKEKQEAALMEVYKAECKNREIEYITSEYRNNILQSWIVMHGIEMSYMYYKGDMRTVFMCSRYSEEFGDSTYYFNSFKECEKVWNMDELDLNKYIKSIIR